jgi:hypothetical protein
MGSAFAISEYGLLPLYPQVGKIDDLHAGNSRYTEIELGTVHSNYISSLFPGHPSHARHLNESNPSFLNESYSILCYG